MSYLVNNQQKITEIIFAGRNKDYGAYVLRSSYGFTVLKSLLYLLTGLSAFIVTAWYLSEHGSGSALSMAIGQLKDDSVYVIPFNGPPHPPPADPGRPAPAAGAAAAGTRIVDTLEAAADTTSHEPLASPAGTTNATTDVLPGPGDAGSATAGSAPGHSLTADTAEAPYSMPDSNPEFNGGLKALYGFLNSHLKYPEPAFEVGKEGTVYVKFVVDQHGKVGNLSLLNTQGFGLDQEALRVVSMIPDFKTPGMVNGRAVKVYYQLPIRFKLK